MSVLDYESGDKFIARVFKNHVNNPNDQWVNSYEFKANEAGTIGVIIDLCEQLVNFESAIHLEIVNFVRITFSTWEADSVPYDPSAFFSTTTTAIGGRDVPTDALGLNSCLAVARVASSGRFGHIFYRGALLEADVEAPAGRTILSDKPGLQTTIETALTSSGLDATIGALSDGPFQMCMIDATGAVTRNIIELLAQGVSSLPQDHAWFNRTSP